MRKVIVFMINLKIDFWSDLVPTWLHLGPPNPPKMGPSWLQNRCKLECWFESCFWKDVGTMFIDFLPQLDMAEVANYIEKNNCFLLFFNFWLLCCWDDLLIDFWSIFDWFGGRKSTNKTKSKIDQKNDQKQNAIWDGFWRALGAILGRFWAQVGGQVGAKMAPKSNTKRCQQTCTKMILKKSCGVARCCATVGGSL